MNFLTLPVSAYNILDDDNHHMEFLSDGRSETQQSMALSADIDATFAGNPLVS